MKNYTSFVSLLLILLFSNILTVKAQDLGKMYFDKASALLNQAHYDSAIYVFEKAMHVYKTRNNPEMRIQAYGGKIRSQAELYQLRNASNSAEEAKRIQEEELPYNKYLSGLTTNWIGQVLVYEGNYIPAQRKFMKVLSISDEMDSLHQINIATAKMYLGDIEFVQNKYEDALEFYREAIDLYKVTLGEDHPYTADCRLRFGRVYRNQGSYNLAMEQFEKAGFTYQKAYSNNHPRMAEAYVGVGDIYRYRNANDMAKEYYDQALIIFKKVFGSYNPYLCDAYLGLGLVENHHGNYPEALIYYSTARDIYDATVGNYHPGVVQCYLYMGNVALNEDNYGKAKEYYNLVIESNYDLRGENHMTSSAAYNNMASIYYFNGDYETAIDYYELALSVDFNIHGKKHPDVANAYYNIAEVYEERHMYSIALEKIQEAICATVTDFDHEDNPFLNPELKNYFSANDLLTYFKFKGETLVKNFAHKKGNGVRGMSVALQTFQLCDSLIDKIRQSHVSEKDKITLAQIASSVYAGAIDVCFQLHQNLNPQNYTQLNFEDKTLAQIQRYYLDRLFYFSEKNKSSILASSIAETEAKAFGGIPDSLLVIEGDIRKNISAYKLELAAKPDSTTRVYYQQMLFKAHRQYDSLIEHFEASFPKYHQLKYDIGYTPTSKIQKMLSEKSALISFFETKTELYIKVLTHNDLWVEKKTKPEKYRKLITGFRNGIFYKSARKTAKSGHDIYQLLFPDNLPQTVEKLILIPEGVMTIIPFETLVTAPVHKDSIRTKSYSNFPFLIKKYDISYASSANLFYKTFHHEFENESLQLFGQETHQDLLTLAPVFADGTTSEANERSLKTLEIINNSEAETGEITRGKLLNGDHVAALPGTEKEVNTIHGMFTEKNLRAEVRTHDQANETFLKSGILDKDKYIHVGTHGFVNESAPELSGILLAQVENETQDGILYAGEIYNLRLNSEMVILSACQTGLGRITKGEGVMGLTRALLYAGTKSLTVSLWTVSDASTSQLMVDFYDNLLEEDEHSPHNHVHANALRKAKLKMIAKGGAFAAPYYWSPFILNGK